MAITSKLSPGPTGVAPAESAASGRYRAKFRAPFLCLYSHSDQCRVVHQNARLPDHDADRDGAASPLIEHPNGTAAITVVAEIDLFLTRYYSQPLISQKHFERLFEEARSRTREGLEALTIPCIKEMMRVAWQLELLLVDGPHHRTTLDLITFRMRHHYAPHALVDHFMGTQFTESCTCHQAAATREFLGLLDLSYTHLRETRYAFEVGLVSEHAVDLARQSFSILIEE